MKYYDNDMIKIGQISCFIKYSNCLCMQNNCNCNSFNYFAIIYEIVDGGVYVAAGDNFRYNSTGLFHRCTTTIL